MSIDEPQGAVVIRDFPGLMTNMDPNDFEPGAAEVQLNVASLKPGELRVRAGFRDVSFED